MAAGGLLRMAMSPVLAFGAYSLLRPVSPLAGMTVGAVLMLAVALAPFGHAPVEA